MSTVTIGFVPRERFSLAAECLQRIFTCTEIPFKLIVVNCNIPSIYWAQMQQALRGHDNVKVIQTLHYLLPGQAKNLVISEAKGEFLCMIENDVLVKDAWLSQLIAACQEHPADVAIPLIIQGRPGSRGVHFDDLLGEVREVATPNGAKLEILPRTRHKALDIGGNRRTVQFIEQHCGLFRRSVFDKIGPYAEDLNTRDEIDLSLALYHANARIVLEPKCEVHFLPPYTLDLPARDELDYFFMRWDLEGAAKSRERIRKKWHLIETPGDMGFVKERNLIGQTDLVREELINTVSNEPFILVDQGWWLDTPILNELNATPFLERNGAYWGPPANDEIAIQELQRLLDRGLRFVVVGWPGFCWLDYYPGLQRYLRSRFRCVLENDRLITFEV